MLMLSLLPRHTDFTRLVFQPMLPITCMVPQVVVNYSSSSGPADEVAHIIEEAGGQAITIGADISKPAEVDR